MDVGTQTYHSTDRAIEVAPSNINLVINEIDTPSTTFNRTRNERRVAYNYNSIMCDYHKNLNEHGHSIFKWRENEDVHKKVAKKAVSSFLNMGIRPPHWLNQRATKYSTY